MADPTVARLDPADLAAYVRSQTGNGRELVDELRRISLDDTDIPTAKAIALAALLQAAMGPESPDEQRKRDAAEGAAHARAMTRP